MMKPICIAMLLAGCLLAGCLLGCSTKTEVDAQIESLHEKAMVSALQAQGLYLEQYDETGDKAARARSTWIPMAESRRVKLVGTPAEWEPFMAQWLAFPSGAHDDALDVVSGVAQMLWFRFNPQAARRPPIVHRINYRAMYDCVNP